MRLTLPVTLSYFSEQSILDNLESFSTYPTNEHFFGFGQVDDWTSESPAEVALPIYEGRILKEYVYFAKYSVYICPKF